MATSYATIADIVPHPHSSLLRLIRDVGLVVGGSLIVAALAQVVIPLQPVPVTGQTFGVLLIGAALGWRRGSLALLAYLLEGSLGLPFFAGAKGGFGGPTFGYVIGFVIAAALVGFLAERGMDRSPGRVAIAMLLGNIVVYLCGLPWLMISLHLSWSFTLAFGLTPFLLGDTLKLLTAAIALPEIRALVDRRMK
jgi:biotin transport system substrate-specific component